MRLTCLLLFLAVYTGSYAQPRVYNPSIDVQYYRFNLQVSDSNDVIRGDAAISFRLTNNVSQVWFDLIGLKANGKGMVVTSVQENGRPLVFTHRNDSLLIDLDGNRGQLHEFVISYSGIPADGLIFSKNKFGKRTVFGDNWPNRARNWLPSKDHLSDKAGVSFTVTAPDHYKIVANGLMEEETLLPGNLKRTRWNEPVPIPTKVMVIGMADFAVSDPVMAAGVAVTSWIFPEQREAGFADYAPAPAILDYFHEKVGPYAYPKLANVQSKTIFGGMENAGAIFYAEESVTGKKRVTGLLAHEIAHQWFGDAATEKDWPHIWLSEGFATEMSQLYLEHLYGADTMTKMLKVNRKQIIAFTKKQQVPVVDTTRGKDIMKLLNTNSYQKGGWVLHMMRRALGDDMFWKCVKAYYAAYRNGNASSEDFQRIVEKVSGKSWKQFFHQWLYVPENPTVAISSQYDDKTGETAITIAQQTKYVFDISLDLAITDDKGNRVTKTISVSEKNKTYRLRLPGKPAGIEADPDCRLLFEEVR